MAQRSTIEWTEVTWNPTTGCDRVSPGCDNCYAMALAKRLKAMGQERYQRDGDPRTSGPGFAVTCHPDVLDAPLGWRKPRVVFVNSMSDLFHAQVPMEFVRQVFGVMARTPQHTYQVLTKRARRLRRVADQLPWPSNVWIGVSVENGDELGRVDELRRVPAAVRFLSCEPLLGPLDALRLDGIDWVIAGGESGPGARPMDPRWAADLLTDAWARRCRSSSSSGEEGLRRLAGACWTGAPGTRCRSPLLREVDLRGLGGERSLADTVGSVDGDAPVGL